MRLTLENTAALTEKEFFFALLQQNIKSTIFYGVMAWIIAIVVGWIWLVGALLFVPYSILAFVSLAQSIPPFFSAFTATVTYFFLRKHGSSSGRADWVEGGSPRGQLFMFGSSGLQLLSGLIFMSFAVYIFGTLLVWW